jgi:hypothetical protein
MITAPATEVGVEGDFSFFGNGLPANATTGGCTGSDFPLELFINWPFALWEEARIDAVGGYSQIWQTIIVSKPETVKFAWNLLTNDFASPSCPGGEDGCDHGFVSVFEGTGPLCDFQPPEGPALYCPSIQVLAGSAAATIGIPLGSEPPVLASGTYFRQTGWRASALTLPAPGEYTVVFGVAQGLDPFFGTALLVDNVSVVAEPATLALLGIALAGLGVARRRKLH